MAKNKKWLPISDDDIRHIWTDPDGANPAIIAPGDFAQIGTPICGDDSKHEGDDMVYRRTEVSPHIPEAVKFREKAEPILQAIYAALYRDPDTGYFDPDREWDSACDLLELINDEVAKLFPPLKSRTRKCPTVKLDQ